jgi:hypothetical protein
MVGPPHQTRHPAISQYFVLVSGIARAEASKLLATETAISTGVKDFSTSTASAC